MTTFQSFTLWFLGLVLAILSGFALMATLGALGHADWHTIVDLIGVSFGAAYLSHKMWEV